MTQALSPWPTYPTGVRGCETPAFGCAALGSWRTCPAAWPVVDGARNAAGRVAAARIAVSQPPGPGGDGEVIVVARPVEGAAHAVEVNANRHLSDHNLTISQFGVLEALYHLGPLSQRQLADKILRSSGNLTMVIDNLERDGLVRRDADPEELAEEAARA